MDVQALFDLTGKTALVTGGATGIGRMAAEGLVSAGARVLIASRQTAACEATAAELNAMGLRGTAEGFGTCHLGCIAHRQTGYFDEQCGPQLGCAIGGVSA